MSDYLVIDADSHVEEPEQAWDYLPDKYQERRPFPIAVSSRPILGNLNAFSRPRRLAALMATT